MKKVSYIISIASLFYFVQYMFWAGLTNTFTFFWLLLAFIFFVVAMFYDKLPQWFIKIGWSLFLGAVVVLGTLIFQINSYANTTSSSNVDYVIILGAQVRETVASDALKQRLEVAYDYAKDKECKIVVTGGKGKGENISEAECMKRYLLDKGIDAERIICEDQSTTTNENFKFSKKYMDASKQTVVVTSKFHIMRAIKIAQKEGFTNVSGIGSNVKAYTVLNLYTREAFAIIKYYILG